MRKANIENQSGFDLTTQLELEKIFDIRDWSMDDENSGMIVHVHSFFKLFVFGIGGLQYLPYSDLLAVDLDTWILASLN